ncbi:small GTPase-binding protein [Conidiobolus coronatus NRRL 28638]|uniref:Small GTPase-binding protein n=1 Tax=Conidiobolus coronatus (strain ATCC 28846 / CBS 209.66 / NRRL 28638) TaxID=796925 RepID=A0A137PAJ7_CONC2|nr:small GTPase-binding protein [Conidiobolus coronatus NRRL 28638]|eukprot:KXN71951.1 small GTPase-binding protein [Conidiobolus coronatus NRRL 28638]
MTLGRNNNIKPDARKKLVVVGDGGCGKTCMLYVYANNEFPEKYVPTVFENYIAYIKTSGKTVELALWDTAGQEDYDRLRPLSYPETDVVIIGFSIAAPLSLLNVSEKWFPEIHHFCEDSPFLLVGLKKDLRFDVDTLRELDKLNMVPVSPEEGHTVAKSIGAHKYLECSAKTRDGLDGVFQQATKLTLRSPISRVKKNLCMVL